MPDQEITQEELLSLERLIEAAESIYERGDPVDDLDEYRATIPGDRYQQMLEDAYEYGIDEEVIDDLRARYQLMMMGDDVTKRETIETGDSSGYADIAENAVTSSPFDPRYVTEITIGHDDGPYRLEATVHTDDAYRLGRIDIEGPVPVHDMQLYAQEELTGTEENPYEPLIGGLTELDPIPALSTVSLEARYGEFEHENGVIDVQSEQYDDITLYMTQHSDAVHIEPHLFNIDRPDEVMTMLEEAYDELPLASDEAISWDEEQVAAEEALPERSLEIDELAELGSTVTRLLATFDTEGWESSVSLSTVNDLMLTYGPERITIRDPAEPNGPASDPERIETVSDRIIDRLDISQEGEWAAEF